MEGDIGLWWKIEQGRKMGNVCGKGLESSWKISNRAVGEGLIERMAFKQKLGDKEASFADMRWGGQF